MRVVIPTTVKLDQVEHWCAQCSLVVGCSDCAYSTGCRELYDDLVNRWMDVKAVRPCYNKQEADL